MARIAIPPQMLAFQIGESAHIKTGGYLEATPHCVVRSSEIAGKNISRNTFALFMEPDDLEIMKTPDGVDPDKVYLTKAYKIPQLRERWENNMFFKDFNWKTLQMYS
jgi:isopenicillin N synthase-like dioxygenase